MYLYLSKLNYLFEKFLRKIFPKTIYIKIFYAKNKLLGLDNSFKHFTDEQIFENIYILLDYGSSLGEQIFYCIQKLKSKDLAIKFVKQEYQKLKKNRFYEN